MAGAEEDREGREQQRDVERGVGKERRGAGRCGARDLGRIGEQQEACPDTAFSCSAMYGTIPTTAMTVTIPASAALLPYREAMKSAMRGDPVLAADADDLAQHEPEQRRGRGSARDRSAGTRRRSLRPRARRCRRTSRRLRRRRATARRRTGSRSRCGRRRRVGRRRKRSRTAGRGTRSRRARSARARASR